MILYNVFILYKGKKRKENYVLMSVKEVNNSFGSEGKHQKRIPSTSKDPVIVKFSGIDYKNKLYICDESSILPLSYSEIWCVAKLKSDIIKYINEKNEKKEKLQKFIENCPAEFIAKLRHNKNKIHCEYTPDIEESLKQMEKDLYAIKI